MAILKLKAPCKDYIWGGNRLREEYGKQLDSDRIAESWELYATRTVRALSPAASSMERPFPTT